MTQVQVPNVLPSKAAEAMQLGMAIVSAIIAHLADEVLIDLLHGRAFHDGVDVDVWVLFQCIPVLPHIVPPPAYPPDHSATSLPQSYKFLSAPA